MKYMVMLKTKAGSAIEEVDGKPFKEDLADAEAQRLKLYIQARGFVDEEEPIILKSEQKVQELRDKAEKIQRVIDLLIDEQ